MIAWSAYGLVSFIGVLPYVGLTPHLDSAKSAFFSKAAFAAAGSICSSLMRLFYRRETNRSYSWIRMAPAAILLSYSSCLFATVCSNAAREFVSRKHLGEGLAGLFGWATNASAVFLAWSACYLAIRTYQALENEKRDTLRANAPAH